jgi:hypothetical protein
MLHELVWVFQSLAKMNSANDSWRCLFAFRGFALLHAKPGTC